MIFGDGAAHDRGRAQKYELDTTGGWLRAASIIAVKVHKVRASPKDGVYKKVPFNKV